MRERPNLSDRELAQRAERWAFWAIPIGIAAIIVSVVVTYWAVHRSEEMTIASGALDKPQPRLYVGDIKVEQPLRIYVAAPFPKSLTIVQLPLSVRNDGAKTTKGIELLVREPEIIAVDNSSLEAKLESHLPISAAPERHFVTSGNYAYVSFALPDMNPGQAFGVSEPVIASNSTLRTEIKAVSKDGVPMVATLSIVVGLPVTVSIAGEDLHTADYELEILGIKANNESDMVSAFADEINKEQDSYKNEKGLWRYLLDSLMPVHHRALLICPDLKIIKADNGASVYIARDISVAKDASYTMP